MEKIIKFALFFILLWLVSADCPVSASPRRTTQGIIKAQINNDANLHKTPSQYNYTLSQQLVGPVVNVGIGIVDMELNANGVVNFFVDYIGSLNSVMLKFRVRLVNPTNGWKMLQFFFFASQSNIFQVGTVSTSQFSSGLQQGRLALYRPIPTTITTQIDPQIRIFLSGISLKPSPLDEQYSMMQSQYESFKKFSTNIILTRYFQQAIQIKKSLQFRMQEPKIIGKLYTFSIETNCQIVALTYSYVIFSKKVYLELHNFVSGSFSFVGGNLYRFTSLANMDMLLTGLVGFKVPRNDYFAISLNVNHLGGQSNYNLITTHPYLEIYYTNLALQMKLPYICQDCQNSPYIYDRFCVQKCPSGFSIISSGGAKFCDKCDIDKLKVVDTQSGLCVCAKRHFLESGSDSCKPCSYDCMTCDTSFRCLTCDNSFLQTKRTLGSDGRCKCPSYGYFDDKIAQDIVCQKCDTKCLTCRGPRSHDCLTCQIGKQRDSKGFCVCKNGYTQDYDGNCICPPPRSLGPNNICIDTSTSCPPNKTEQFIDLTRRCICKPGFIPILDNCIKCPQNSIFNDQTLKCQCRKPTVEINGECRNCEINKRYDEISKMCVCKDGTFEKNDGSCVVCPPRMVLFNQRCQCAFNYYEDNDGICRRCRRETDGPKCKRNLA